MKSYFDNSMFVKGLKFPVGGNIAPKSDRIKKNYEVNISNNTDINIIKESEIESGKDIFGKFISDEIKNTTIGNCVYQFEINDAGYFVSTINMDDTEVVVQTISNVQRTTNGVNFDEVCYRDGLFKNVKHSDVNHTLNIVDHYKLLKNDKRLIHYSEQSSFFEVYQVPENFKLEDGLTKLVKPELFDDLYYNETDEDIQELESHVKKLKK